jgi:hypothetical protein
MKRAIVLIPAALLLLACDIGGVTWEFGFPPEATQVPVVTLPTLPPPPVAIQPTLPPLPAEKQPALPTLPPLPAATTVPAQPSTPAAEIYDNFDNAAFEDQLNGDLWIAAAGGGACPGKSASQTLARQIKGELVIDVACPGPPYVIRVRKGERPLEKMRYFEARVKIATTGLDTSGRFWMEIAGNNQGSNWSVQCFIEMGSGASAVELGCPDTPLARLNRDQYYKIRMEMNPDSGAVSFYLDGELRGKYQHPTAKYLNNLTPAIGAMNYGPAAMSTIYVDDVRINP